METKRGGNTHIALLRGINVGGRNIIPMARLKELCNGLGWSRPRTLLQSGNLLFETAETDDRVLAALLEDRIQRDCGFRPRVLVLTPVRLRRALADCPFPPDKGFEPGKVLLMFLTAAPSREARASLQAAHGGPERMAFGDGVLYLHYPNGIGRSKLTNAVIENKLGVQGTARNWNTAVKLRDLAEDNP